MEKESRTILLSFRVSPQERERIEEKALESKRKLSRYLRDCALEKPIVVVNGADMFAKELRAIGNNLNQLTREVNAGYVRSVDLSGLKEEVKQIWQSLNSLPRDVR